MKVTNLDCYEGPPILDTRVKGCLVPGGVRKDYWKANVWKDDVFHHTIQLEKFLFSEDAKWEDWITLWLCVDKDTNNIYVEKRDVIITEKMKKQNEEFDKLLNEFGDVE